MTNVEITVPYESFIIKHREYDRDVLGSF